MKQSLYLIFGLFVFGILSFQNCSAPMPELDVTQKQSTKVSTQIDSRELDSILFRIEGSVDPDVDVNSMTVDLLTGAVKIKNIYGKDLDSFTLDKKTINDLFVILDKKDICIYDNSIQTDMLCSMVITESYLDLHMNNNSLVQLGFKSDSCTIPTDFCDNAKKDEVKSFLEKLLQVYYY
jgi:hypothetical protein